MGRGNSSAVNNSTGGGRLLRGQLGGMFWSASYHHNRPGDPVHRCHVAVHVQSPGFKAHADNCLPPPVQQHGRLLPPAAEGSATCQVQRSGLAGTPSLGTVGPTCSAKGRGRCISSQGHIWALSGTAQPAAAASMYTTGCSSQGGQWTFPAAAQLPPRGCQNKS